ncbi:MAG: peptide chain release factor N(5)-glutamine methyltransferase [Clostridia bacterium]|nr:peptide chain release factor N(5)-glutamine methyltransferase [Clostridia bacterium]
MLSDLLSILVNNGVDDPETTLDVLCAYVLGIDYSQLRLRRITKTLTFSAEQQETLRSFVLRRADGEPLEYITGERDFYGFTFRCRKNVLIPRNDTEILVDAVSEAVRDGDRLLDLCTGTGCIGISVSKIKNINAVLADISEDALSCARENIESLGVSDRVMAVKHNIFTDSPDGVFDIITSNPPYITAEEMKELSADVKNEPSLALFGGDDGLDFYRTIAARYRPFIKNGGYIFFEVGYRQSTDVSDILKKNGYTNIKTKKDYNNTERVVYARNSL